jgi:hypothetical protein
VLNKLAYLVLPHRPSPNFLYKIPDDMTSRGHCSVRKVINSINKNLLLLDSKALVPERVGLLLCLSKASNTSGHSSTRAFKVLSCIAIICKLPSLNCSNYGINSLRFEISIAYFVVVLKRAEACFGAGRALVQDVLWCGISVTAYRINLAYVHRCPGSYGKCNSKIADINPIVKH